MVGHVTDITQQFRLLCHPRFCHMPRSIFDPSRFVQSVRVMREQWDSCCSTVLTGITCYGYGFQAFVLASSFGPVCVDAGLFVLDG